MIQNFCRDCWNRSFDPTCIRTGKYECFSISSYADVQKRLIRRAKFNADPFSSYVLEQQLIHAAPMIAKMTYDHVTCVPGLSSRLRTRKYDLPRSSAKRLARKLGIPFSPHLLRRIGKPKKQMRSNREDRRLNVKNSFTAVGSLVGKKVLVVDDVYTTGATCEAIINSLYEVHAQHVTLLVLAHTPESKKRP